MEDLLKNLEVSNLSFWYRHKKFFSHRQQCLTSEYLRGKCWQNKIITLEILLAYFKNKMSMCSEEHGEQERLAENLWTWAHRWKLHEMGERGEFWPVMYHNYLRHIKDHCGFKLENTNRRLKWHEAVRHVPTIYMSWKWSFYNIIDLYFNL